MLDLREILRLAPFGVFVLTISYIVGMSCFLARRRRKKGAKPIVYPTRFRDPFGREKVISHPFLFGLLFGPFYYLANGIWLQVAEVKHLAEIQQ